MNISETTPIVEDKAINQYELAHLLQRVLPRGIRNSDVYFICIGTDRSTGDAFGPLIGTELIKRGYTNVVGTIDDPVHAMNLDEIIATLPKHKKIIAIDACLGKVESIGKMGFNTGPMKPGAGVNKNLTPVGDYALTGIVNVSGFMEYFVLQNTRLATVMKMAGMVVNAISNVLPNR
jgi:putative sporulation protein YyaC